MRTRIKICGLTRAADVAAAVQAGADALGFVFYPKSPRYIPPEEARALVRMLPAWVASVGLFVNARPDEMQATADRVGLSHLQLHGDESPEVCQAMGRPVIKALRIRETPNDQALEAESQRLDQLLSQYADCHALLLDAESPGFGGSGQRFDWRLVPRMLSKYPARASTWVLSGGLESTSVQQAILALQPPCVDVSSGVERRHHETIVKGEKDPILMQDFVRAVQSADKKR